MYSPNNASDVTQEIARSTKADKALANGKLLFNGSFFDYPNIKSFEDQTCLNLASQKNFLPTAIAQLAEAIELYNQIPLKHRTSHDQKALYQAYAYMGECMMKERKYTEALAEFDLALEQRDKCDIELQSVIELQVNRLEALSKLLPEKFDELKSTTDKLEALYNQVPADKQDDQYHHEKALFFYNKARYYDTNRMYTHDANKAVLEAADELAEIVKLNSDNVDLYYLIDQFLKNSYLTNKRWPARNRWLEANPNWLGLIPHSSDGALFDSTRIDKNTFERNLHAMRVAVSHVEHLIEKDDEMHKLKAENEKLRADNKLLRAVKEKPSVNPKTQVGVRVFDVPASKAPLKHHKKKKASQGVPVPRP